jgi:hypothetical protein
MLPNEVLGAEGPLYVPPFMDDLMEEILLRENLLKRKILHTILPLESSVLKKMLSSVNVERSLRKQLLDSQEGMAHYTDLISFVCINPRDVIRDGRIYGRYGFLCEQVPYIDAIDFVTAAMVMILVAQQDETISPKKRVFLGKRFNCPKGLTSFLCLKPPSEGNDKWWLTTVLATDETSFIMDDVDFIFGIKCVTGL